MWPPRHRRSSNVQRAVLCWLRCAVRCCIADAAQRSAARPQRRRLKAGCRRWDQPGGCWGWRQLGAGGWCAHEHLPRTTALSCLGERCLPPQCHVEARSDGTSRAALGIEERRRTGTRATTGAAAACAGAYDSAIPPGHPPTPLRRQLLPLLCCAAVSEETQQQQQQQQQQGQGWPGRRAVQGPRPTTGPTCTMRECSSPTCRASTRT